MRLKILLKKFTFTLAFATIVFSNISTAENMKKLGSFNVHYIAIGATFLSPEIATTYAIERSKYNALVNISVLDNTQESTPAKHVSLTGQAINDAGQMKKLSFEKVTEGDAIYYLAQVNFRHDETINFTINITDGSETQELKFSQKFYVD